MQQCQDTTACSVPQFLSGYAYTALSAVNRDCFKSFASGAELYQQYNYYIRNGCMMMYLLRSNTM